MSSSSTFHYRFDTAAHWQRGLSVCFDADRHGAWRAIPQFSREVLSVTSGEHVDLVAVAPEGVPYWRATSSLRWLTFGGEPSGPAERPRAPGAPLPSEPSISLEPSRPFEISGVLAASPRWALDRSSIWGFAPGASTVTRVRRASLDGNITFDVSRAVAADTGDDELLAILDIASDTCTGLWVLAGDASDRQRLVHLDERGCVRRVLDVPLCAGAALQIGVLKRSHVIAVLAGDGRCLLLIDARNDTTPQVRPLSFLGCGWCAARLATDGRNRIAVLGQAAGEPAQQVYVLDASGEVIDGPLAPAAMPSDARECGDPGENGPRGRDIAIHRDKLWLATREGLKCFGHADNANGSIASVTSNTPAESYFLTPLLLSVETDRGRGWLRAELDIDLPPDAFLEAECFGTDSAEAAASIRETLSMNTGAVVARIDAILAQFDDADISRFTFTGPSTPDAPIAIPLFQVERRWLMVGLRVISPPGVALPTMRALTVRYPNLSAEQNLPAIFRGKLGDPTGFLRRIAGVLETTTQRQDARIASIGAALDPARAPVALLDYMAGWLGVPWHESLPEAAKRAVLGRAADITAKRATLAGLDIFLGALLDGAGQFNLTDLTGQYVAARLGGRARPANEGANEAGARHQASTLCAGTRLPALLAGTPRGTATLGAKAILGCMKLPCAAAPDPLSTIVPQVTIRITTNAATRAALSDLLEGLLRDYVPAGVAIRIHWKIGAAGEPWILQGQGPGLLGVGSRIGRVVLAGDPTPRLRDTGLDLGFVLT